MGRKIVLGGTHFTDNTLPKLSLYDQMEAPGSLMIMDVRDFAAGVPAHQALLPNRAKPFAQNVLGSAVDADLKAQYLVGSSFPTTPARGKAERTTKGGLHVITPQSGSAVDFETPSVNLPLKMTQYVLQNPTHLYYSSMWVRLTRKPTVNTHYFYMIAAGGQQTNACLIVAGPPAPNSTAYSLRPVSGTNPYLGYLYDPAVPDIGPNFLAVGSKDYYSANGVPDVGKGSPAGASAKSGFGWGKSFGVGGIGLTGVVTGGVSLNAGNKDSGASFAVYRFVFEDLTVSGRSYAAAQAIDRAMYGKEVLTAGGAFYNDTMTDPATIP